MAGKSKTGVFYGWVIVAAASVILLLERGCNATYGIFLTELRADLGWTTAMVSGAYSLFFIWHTVIYIPGGRLNDKYGPRLMLMISAVVMGIGYALMSIIETPWQLYIFYGVVIGTGLGFGHLPIVSTVSRWFVKTRGTALGITIAGSGAGTLILAPFAQFLITKFDWRTSYLILAALLVVIVLPVSRLMRLNPSEKRPLPYGMEKIATKGKQHDSPLPSTADFSLRQAIRTRQFWLLSMMYAFFIFAIQMVMIHLKAYAIGFGIVEMTAATILGVAGGSSILGGMVVGSVSDKIGRKTSFFICFLLMAVMLLWLMKARQPWQFYFFSALFGFGYGGCTPLFPAVSADWFGTKFHGTIFGLLSVSSGIGGAIGPLLAGYIYDITGNYELAIIIGATTLFIAMGLSFVIKAPQIQKPS